MNTGRSPFNNVKSQFNDTSFEQTPKDIKMFYGADSDFKAKYSTT
jgi:hypothetical protein